MGMNHIYGNVNINNVLQHRIKFIASSSFLTKDLADFLPCQRQAGL